MILDKILAFLTPMLLDVAKGDETAAGQAARSMLDSYAPANDQELWHAALAIAFSFGALDALGRSADTALSLNEVLRLRGSASVLNRAALLNEQVLQVVRKPDPADSAPALDLPASLEPADLLDFAKKNPGLVPRQQRRELERRVAKADRRAQEQTRLAARAAEIAARRVQQAA
jgi:hypothetical protein